METQSYLVPEAGFSLSARKHNSFEKIYVNICHSPKIADAKAYKGLPPGDTSASHEHTGSCHHDDSHFEIPFVIGPPRKDDGTGRTIYDFVFGSQTAARALRDTEFQSALISKCVYRTLMNQFGEKIDRKYKISKRYNFRGVNRKPLISEISSATATIDGSKTEHPSIQKDEAAERTKLSDRVCEYTITRTAERICVTIELPELDSVTDTSLSISSSQVSFSAKNLNTVSIDLPVPVKIDTATAQFDSRLHLLRVFAQLDTSLPETIESTSEKKPSLSGAKTRQITPLYSESKAPAPHEHHHHYSADEGHRHLDKVQTSAESEREMEELHEDDSQDMATNAYRASRLPFTAFHCFDSHHPVPFSCRQTIDEVIFVLHTPNVSKVTHQNLQATLVEVTLENEQKISVVFSHMLAAPVDPSKCSIDIGVENVVIRLRKHLPRYWESLKNLQSGSRAKDLLY